MKKKCISCGAKIDSGSKFCVVCGASQSKTQKSQPKFKFEQSKDIIAIEKGKQVVYFENGYLFDMAPPPPQNFYENRDLAYNADIIVSDDKCYDLSDPNDILKIHVPAFDRGNDEGGAVFGLDYILRMKAGICYEAEQDELCSALLWKSTELMLANKKTSWSRKDLNRIIFWHYELGMPQEAEKAQRYLNSFPIYSANRFDVIAKQVRDTVFSQSKQYKFNLVVFHDYGHGCCEDCAKLSGRVYRIRGINLKYPKLPKYVFEHGNFHTGCRCLMSAYFGDDIYHHGNEVNAFAASRRPYVDDRTAHEIEAYQDYINIMQKEIDDEKKRLESSRIKGINRKEYLAIKKALPHLAPKSLSGYIRMKNSNSRNFVKIQENAQNLGIIISST